MVRVWSTKYPCPLLFVGWLKTPHRDNEVNKSIDFGPHVHDLRD
jgi:hypothetical protein